MGSVRVRVLYSFFILSLILIGAPAAKLDRANASPGSAGAEADLYQFYMPTVLSFYPTTSVFGFETVSTITANSNAANAGLALGGSYARMNGRVSWRRLQPVQGGPIDWSQLNAFKSELRLLKDARVKPVVVVDDYPLWAVKPFGDSNTLLTCAALRTEAFSAFGEFLSQLAAYFAEPEFDVQVWELGNEPDVDPAVMPQNSVFGCWGDKADPYYGGEHYGEMLKVVTPMVKAANPRAQVWIGGLLLDAPFTTQPDKGNPERFLEGILRSGAAPYFDAVPYHWYPSFTTRTRIDFDLNPANVWYSRGGGVVGKASFLRETMQAYGVNKPVLLNETALGCNWCEDEDKRDAREPLFLAQADFAVRSFTRGLAADIKGFMWYTLEGPGWRLSGFLDDQGNQKPVYRAYSNLYHQTLNAAYIGPVTYGDPNQFEGYAFRRSANRLEIVWTITDSPTTISIPQGELLAVYDLLGSPLAVTFAGGFALVPVGFSPIYIVRTP